MNLKHHISFRHAAIAVVLLALTVTGAASPAKAQTFTDLLSFTGEPNPAYPLSVVQGRDGNLYGGSYQGGANNLGTIFKVTPAGVATVIYSLTAADGNPDCNPIVEVLGTDGNFYGSCSYNSNGYIFKVTPTGVFTHLYNFSGTDGAEPMLAFQGSNGNYYGFCESGGSGGVGTIFMLTPTGILTTIYSFTSSALYYEPAGLVQSSNGDFYGVTYTGNTTSGGVFKLTPAGVFTGLHEFLGGATDGANPSTFTQGTDGNFYGVTEYSGVYNEGIVYKITPTGTFTLLHSFNMTTDGGGYPGAALMEASDGNFYSTAASCYEFGCYSTENIYKITSAGVYTSLASFDITNGYLPFYAPIQDTSGILYGVTYEGGTGSVGVFYSLNNSLSAYAGLVSTSGKIGKVIGILGQGFSASSVVKFGGVQATTVTLSGSKFISATVPAAAHTGSVTVTTGATTLTSIRKFLVTPAITSFTPPSGPVGTPVMITGSGLTQTTKVTFGGVTATTVTVNSDTQVTADVPTGAVTGKIAITTPGGTATSMTVFTVN